MLSVILEQAWQNVIPAMAARPHRIDLLLHAKQAELREGRGLEFVIGEDTLAGAMVHGYQLDFVEIRDLAQLLSDPDLIMIVLLLQRTAGNLNVFLVVDREVLAIAVAGPQWRYAQHVGDELERASIPGKDHGARSGKPWLLFIGH